MYLQFKTWRFRIHPKSWYLRWVNSAEFACTSQVTPFKLARALWYLCVLFPETDSRACFQVPICNPRPRAADRFKWDPWNLLGMSAKDETTDQINASARSQMVHPKFKASQQTAQTSKHDQWRVQAWVATWMFRQG